MGFSCSKSTIKAIAKFHQYEENLEENSTTKSDEVILTLSYLVWTWWTD